MEIRHFKYFVQIVEAGSITRASLALHVAQPALSKQISQLEAEVGTKLLLRTVRGVTVTEAGQAVYQHAKVLLKQVDATLGVAKLAQGEVSGDVVIGLPWTISSLLGLALIIAVQAEFPGIRLEISTGSSSEISRMVSQGRLDLAVVFGVNGHAALRVQPLANESLWLIGTKGTFLGKNECSVEEAAALPLLLMSRPNIVREELDAIWQERGIVPNVVAEVNLPGLLIEAVEAGIGYGILPSCALDERTREARIDGIELLGSAPRRTVCLATSILFPLSLAAQKIHGLLERLAYKSVDSGCWKASRISAEERSANEL